MSVFTILVVVALILFVLAAVGVPVGNVNLIAAGLAFYMLAILIGGRAIT